MCRRIDVARVDDSPESYFNSRITFSSTTEALEAFAGESLSFEKSVEFKEQIDREMKSGQDDDFVLGDGFQWAEPRHASTIPA